MPDNIGERLDVAEAVGRISALGHLEAFRQTFLDENALDVKTQRLVHVAMTLASADNEVIASHLRSATKAGASPAELRECGNRLACRHTTRDARCCGRAVELW